MKKETKCKFCEAMQELVKMHEEEHEGEEEKEEDDKAVKNNKKGW